MCRAQQSQVAKALAAGVSLPALLAAHPAFALVSGGSGQFRPGGCGGSGVVTAPAGSRLEGRAGGRRPQRSSPRPPLAPPLSPATAQVDDRLGGDGVGLPLGVSDPNIFYNMVAVFGTVWALYYLGTRDLGGDNGDDSGMTL